MASLEDMRVLFAGIPLGEVSTSMTINSSAAIALAMYLVVGEEQGVPRDRAPRDDPDGHPQGVHRPEGVHLPAGAVDAARDGHGRVLRGGDAALASDLDLRLPHPRGGLDGRAGARVHAEERLHVRRVGARARARRRCVRAAALVLLQRASRLLRGDREVPRGAADLGARDARPVRRAGRALAADALPHADGRGLADVAAAARQRRPDGDRGARGGARRDAVAAHELLRRGARAADRGRGAARAAHAAGDRARDRRRQLDRPARRLLPRRGADEPARGGGVRAVPADRRARRDGRRDRAEHAAARDRRGGVPLPAGGRGGGAGRRRRQPLPRPRPTRRSTSCASTPTSSASRSSGSPAFKARRDSAAVERRHRGARGGRVGRRTAT